MDRSIATGAFGTLEEFLEHYGVKGMKWGVRRKRPGMTRVEVAAPAGRRVQTRGGSGQRASEDAIRAAVARQKARKSTTDSLSNRELQELVTRLNLEQQYERLRPRRPSEQVAKFITDTLIGIGRDEATKYIRSGVSSQIDGVINKK